MAVRRSKSHLFTPLASRVYKHLLYAQMLSLLGTGLATVALALLAYELAGDRAGVVLGTALTIKMLAYVGIAPLASEFAGRIPRRAYLVSLDLIRAAVVLVLPFVDQVWQIYVLIFVLQSASAAFTPAFRATIPDVLPDEQDFTKAMSLSRIAYDMEQLLSPSLAAALLSVISFHWLFIGTAIGFLASAALVMSVVLPVHTALRDDDRYIDRLSRGIRIYLKTPRLRGVLAVHFAVAAAGAMVIVNTVVLVHSRFGGAAGDVALMMAMVGCGSILMALALPSLLAHRPARSVMIYASGSLVLCLLLGFATANLIALGSVWFLIGAGMSAAQTPTEIVLRNSTTQVDRPSVYAAQFALSHACWLVAYPAAGWLGATIGLENTFVAMAGLTCLGVVSARVLWPGVDPVELLHTHRPVEHSHWHVHDEHHRHTHDNWDGTEPHVHAHTHTEIRHSHAFVIDRHHPHWPRGGLT